MTERISRRGLLASLLGALAAAFFPPRRASAAAPAAPAPPRSDLAYLQGGQTCVGVTSLTYDAAGRLTAITDDWSSNLTTIAYDFDGRLIPPPDRKAMGRPSAGR